MADPSFKWLSNLKIHQIVSLGGFWSKHFSRLSKRHLKLGDIAVTFSNCQIPHFAKEI